MRIRRVTYLCRPPERSDGRRYTSGDANLAESAQKGQNGVMAQAIMDPEEVRRFAEELKRFNTDLRDRLVSLQARFAALGDTWQDQEQGKFAEEFKQTMKAL